MLTHWSYVFLALTHQFHVGLIILCRFLCPVFDASMSVLGKATPLVENCSRLIETETDSEKCVWVPCSKLSFKLSKWYDKSYFGLLNYIICSVTCEMMPLIIMVKFWNSCISEWEGRLTLHKGGGSRSFMTMTIWCPRSGVWVYQIVTGVTSVVGMPSTHLVFCRI